jgi:hypothetical protein
MMFTAARGSYCLARRAESLSEGRRLVEHGRREAFLDEEGTRARPWETARRVLQAAAVEAYGRPGAYVRQDRVMQRANMVDTEHFRMIAKYLEERGWIAEADADYGVFVVTASGIEEATS